MALTRKEITQWTASAFGGHQRASLSGALTRVATDAVNVTTATYNVPLSTYGIDMVVTLNRAAGITVTLPPATGTLRTLKFYVGTLFTGNGIIQVTTTDIIQGAIHLTTDIAGTSMPTSTTTDTITMNGSTTGGLVGSYIELQDVASGVWRLSGGIICSGAEATPFSAAVS